MENLNIKKTTQDVLKWTTIGGSAVISVGAIMALTKVKDVKSAIMPLVTLLVGVSAFSYAMTEKVGFIPKTDGKTEEPKSEIGDSGGGGLESPRYRYKKKLSPSEGGTIIFK